MTNRQKPVQLLVLLAAIGLVVLWYFSRSTRPEAVTLSKPTHELLAKLTIPIQMRFYHSATNAFESHSLKLLRAYETEAKGKITLTDLQVTGDQAASDAIADGVRPFNLEKGDAAFLGIVMQAGEMKESLPVLSPEFASALEADITRALERLLSRAQQAQPEPAKPDESAIQRVTTLVPNYKEVSIEEGAKKVRESMLSDLQKAGAEFDARRAELGALIEKATAAGDQAQLETLRKAVTQAELEQAEKLKRIVSESTANLQALEKLKAQP